MLGGPGYPGAGGLHPQRVDGRPGRKQHRPMVGPALGTVRRDFGQANDPQVVAGGVKDPAPFRARALDSPCNIHLHAVGNAVRRRSHSGKNAVVAPGPVSGHVKGTVLRALPRHCNTVHTTTLWAWLCPS